MLNLVFNAKYFLTELNVTSSAKMFNFDGSFLTASDQIDTVLSSISS